MCSKPKICSVPALGPEIPWPGSDAPCPVCRSDYWLQVWRTRCKDPKRDYWWIECEGCGNIVEDDYGDTEKEAWKIWKKHTTLKA